MKLSELIKNLSVLSVNGDIDRDVTDISYHHERVIPGAVFVAIKGNTDDGNRFIVHAVKNGASAVISETKNDLNGDVASIVVKDTRAALARISATYFDYPSKKLKLIGVTGTNGKTTITYLLESIFKEAGWLPGVIGTVEHRYGNCRVSSANTTPESYDLQRLLNEMVSSGVKACAMEVSSHALVFQRVIGCNFDGAIFTNLSPEHLDFHGNMENYFESKMLLFRKRLAESSKSNVFSVINFDDPYGEKLSKELTNRMLSYSLNGSADVTASDIVCNSTGINMRVKTPLGEFLCSSKLLGRFSAYNILAAVAAGIGLGLDTDTIRQGIEKVSAVPGRLEKVENKRDILALVDYAHTPDALEKVLLHARYLVRQPKGRLIVVFGCGGNRDRAKRPLMGKVAEELADIVIVTSDNPRQEDPDDIIDEIVSGMNTTPSEIIADRKEAIRHAAKIASNGDVVIIAGKGHEDYQIVGSDRRHFDDREMLREFLN